MYENEGLQPQVGESYFGRVLNVVDIGKKRLIVVQLPKLQRFGRYDKLSFLCWMESTELGMGQLVDQRDLDPCDIVSRFPLLRVKVASNLGEHYLVVPTEEISNLNPARKNKDAKENISGRQALLQEISKLDNFDGHGARAFCCTDLLNCLELLEYVAFVPRHEALELRFYRGRISKMLRHSINPDPFLRSISTKSGREKLLKVFDDHTFLTDVSRIFKYHYHNPEQPEYLREIIDERTSSKGQDTSRDKPINVSSIIDGSSSTTLEAEAIEVARRVSGGTSSDRRKCQDLYVKLKQKLLKQENVFDLIDRAAKDVGVVALKLIISSSTLKQYKQLQSISRYVDHLPEAKPVQKSSSRDSKSSTKSKNTRRGGGESSRSSRGKQPVSKKAGRRLPSSDVVDRRSKRITRSPSSHFADSRYDRNKNEYHATAIHRSYSPSPPMSGDDIGDYGDGSSNTFEMNDEEKRLLDLQLKALSESQVLDNVLDDNPSAAGRYGQRRDFYDGIGDRYSRSPSIPAPSHYYRDHNSPPPQRRLPKRDVKHSRRDQYSRSRSVSRPRHPYVSQSPPISQDRFRGAHMDDYDTRGEFVSRKRKERRSSFDRRSYEKDRDSMPRRDRDFNRYSRSRSRERSAARSRHSRARDSSDSRSVRSQPAPVPLDFSSMTPEELYMSMTQAGLSDPFSRKAFIMQGYVARSGFDQDEFKIMLAYHVAKSLPRAYRDLDHNHVKTSDQDPWWLWPVERQEAPVDEVAEERLARLRVQSDTRMINRNIGAAPNNSRNPNYIRPPPVVPSATPALVSSRPPQSVGYVQRSQNTAKFESLLEKLDSEVTSLNASPIANIETVGGAPVLSGEPYVASFASRSSASGSDREPAMSRLHQQPPEELDTYGTVIDEVTELTYRPNLSYRREGYLIKPPPVGDKSLGYDFFSLCQQGMAE